jgi:hypothetical protein
MVLWLCIIVAVWLCDWYAESQKNEQENPQEVEMRLTLKGHHKCVATVPLARNPSYVLLTGPFGLQSVFFTSLHKTAFLTTPNGWKLLWWRKDRQPVVAPSAG